MKISALNLSLSYLNPVAQVVQFKLSSWTLQIPESVQDGFSAFNLNLNHSLKRPKVKMSDSLHRLNSFRQLNQIGADASWKSATVADIQPRLVSQSQSQMGQKGWMVFATKFLCNS